VVYASTPAFAVRSAGLSFEQHHLPLVEAYDGPRLEHHLFSTDHALSDHRKQLGRTMLAFLQRNLGGLG
jgi:hypothetical protein